MLKLVKEYCPCVQVVREMVSVQVNQLLYNLNKNRKNSQRSSSAYCDLTKSKHDIDQLLLTIKIGQDMTYSPAERVTCPHVTQCNISGWQIKNPSFRFRIFILNNE